jgi:putative photosynthetic complex assembly protein 2
MSDFVAPAGFAVLVWWFTTGAILLLDGMPRRTFPWSMGAATLVLAGAGYLLHTSSGDPSTMGAYTAFTSAILVWGWLEMSFLMGFITGPRKSACSERCSGWTRFIHATQAIIYNELATLVVGGAVLADAWGAANRVAAWTYLVLWGMRLSAKLNLFLGVPNVGEKFLPPHLHYLKGFFRRRPMNLLFPISISVSTVATVLLLQRYSAAEGFGGTAYALVASLLALAVIEHWFMVLPLPSERMWHWALRSNRTPTVRGLEQNS